MPRLSKKMKQEWDLFINPETGRRTYNTFCRKCSRKCKQSFRAEVIDCPGFQRKREKGSKAPLSCSQTTVVGSGDK